MAQVRNNVEQQGVLPLDCPLRGEIRGERSIMDFPFFALEKKTGVLAWKLKPSPGESIRSPAVSKGSQRFLEGFSRVSLGLRVQKTREEDL